MDVTHSIVMDWDLEMAMESRIFHDPLNFDHLLHQNSPFQTSQTPSTTHVPSSSFLRNREEKKDHEDVEVEKEEDEEELSSMKEMIYKIAAMQPVDIDPATIHKPKRRNVRISDDPQSVAARHRREKISERIRILQRLVPGGTKMDTATMLDEAIRYVKFLKRQVRKLQSRQPPPSIEPCTSHHFEDNGNWPTTGSHNIHLGSSFSTHFGANNGNIPCNNHED